MMQIYFLTILVTILSIYLYGSFIPSFCIFLVTRSSVNNPNRNRTLALENLISAPTLGHFFYEELIHDYVYLEEWEKILNVSKEAVESPLHKNNFVIWYYKATAECLLKHIQECERSARVANGLSPYDEDSSISHLYRLAQVMKENSAIRMIKKGNDIMIIHEGTQDEGRKINEEPMFSEPFAEIVTEQIKNEHNEFKKPPEITEEKLNLEEF